MKKTQTASNQKGFLAFVEHMGNRLPDPVFIFVILIGILVVSHWFVRWQESLLHTPPNWPKVEQVH